MHLRLPSRSYPCCASTFEFSKNDLSEWSLMPLWLSLSWLVLPLGLYFSLFASLSVIHGTSQFKAIVETLWKLTLGLDFQVRCFHHRPLYKSWLTIQDIITDVAMLILPFPFLWRLNTSRNQKIGLTITFLTFSVYMPPSPILFDRSNWL